MGIPAELTGMHLCLLTAEDRIDHALDREDHRAFRLWCKRRSSLSSRIQRTLLALLA